MQFIVTNPRELQLEVDLPHFFNVWNEAPLAETPAKNMVQVELESTAQSHKMVTRFKAKSIPITHTSVATVQTKTEEHKSIKEALNSPHWLKAMQEELAAFPELQQ